MATKSLPITPAAPALFSTTKDWPVCSCSACPSVRVRMSEAPAGGDDEISRTDRFGQADCAEPERAASSAAPAASM